MANIITVIRIICSIGLLFIPVFSPAFYVLYLIAGVSDMVDGTIARKTGTVSDFGSKPIIDLKYSGVIVCVLATLAAIQEGHLIRTGVKKKLTDDMISHGATRRNGVMCKCEACISND